MSFVHRNDRDWRPDRPGPDPDVAKVQKWAEDTHQLKTDWRQFQDKFAELDEALERLHASCVKTNRRFQSINVTPLLRHQRRLAGIMARAAAL